VICEVAQAYPQYTVQQIYRELPVIEVLEMLNEKIYCEQKYLYRQLQCMKVAFGTIMSSSKDRSAMSLQDSQQKPRRLWSLQPDELDDFKKDVKKLNEIIEEKGKNDELTEP
jgi:hypothetical protein